MKVSPTVNREIVLPRCAERNTTKRWADQKVPSNRTSSNASCQKPFSSIGIFLVASADIRMMDGLMDSDSIPSSFSDDANHAEEQTVLAPFVSIKS